MLIRTDIAMATKLDIWMVKKKLPINSESKD